MATILETRWAARRAEERELGLAEGRELGLAQGRELRRADERNRLRRWAALKFGSGTAERLADRLADLTTFEDLDRVGDWIIECESGDICCRACTPSPPPELPTADPRTRRVSAFDALVAASA